MEVIDYLKKCETDEDIKDLVDACIEVFTNQARRENPDTNCFGAELDINPVNKIITNPNIQPDSTFKCVNVWNGYLPLGMKVVYAGFHDKEHNTMCHKGCYYYLDDDSYVYEFFKFIKDKDIEDEFDIINLVNDYINMKFTRVINAKDRNEINKLILKDENTYLRPVREHSIKDFFENGSAMCTELSVIAENLISALGLEIICIQDYRHSYNIFAHHKEDSTDVYILDYAEWVECFDLNNKFLGTYPFFQKIENGDAKMLDEAANDGKRFIMNDYYLYRINGEVYEIITSKKRNYGVDYNMEREKTLKLKREKGN